MNRFAYGVEVICVIMGIFLSFILNFFFGIQALNFLVVIGIAVLIVLALYYVKSNEK